MLQVRQGHLPRICRYLLAKGACGGNALSDLPSIKTDCFFGDSRESSGIEKALDA
jgi:hypothetical protein